MYTLALLAIVAGALKPVGAAIAGVAESGTEGGAVSAAGLALDTETTFFSSTGLSTLGAEADASGAGLGLAVVVLT